MSCDVPTFIVTAELDSENFQWLNGLRRLHFPAARNFLDAHLTLFHKLDAAAVSIIKEVVELKAVGVMTLRFQSLRMLGRGVAIEVTAPDLSAIRSACASALEGRLTAQDRQLFRPHVTIQNKVDLNTAKDLHANLQAGFVERTGSSEAILIWRYLGGPWQLSERLAFKPS